MRPVRVLAGAAAVALALTACNSASSTPEGDYPADEVRLLVPYSAGGPTDVAARAVAKYMEQELGQTFVVENIEGASGATAYQEMFGQEPDGYTLTMTALPTAVLNTLANDVGYTKDDFAQIGAVSQVPSAFMVPADSPYKDLKSLFEAAKSGEEISVATPGSTNTHAAETMRITKMYDVPLTIVPFEGGTEVVASLLGGNTDAGFTNTSSDVVQALNSGKIRALAAGTAEPIPYVDAPTFQELGYPNLTASVTTFGLAAPDGTPDEVLSELEKTLEQALKDPATIKAIDERYVPEKFIDGEQLAEMFTQTEETFGDTFEE